MTAAALAMSARCQFRSHSKSSPRAPMRSHVRAHTVVGPLHVDQVLSGAGSNAGRYAPLASDDPDSEYITRRKAPRHTTVVKQVPRWRLRGTEILESVRFQCLMATLIVLNAVMIGLETDLRDYHHWDSFENVFLLCFAIELMFKFVILGHGEFFTGPDSTWNAFDLLIVTIGVVDVLGSFMGRPPGGLATLFRVIRLLRILRILRLVRFLKELYLLAFGFIEAAKAVFWVTVLMAFMLYVCAILLVRTLGRQDPSAKHAAFLNDHFGSVLISMWSLFELMASPNLPDYTAQDGLLFEHPLFAMFLVGFVIFGSFGMIALLTGVISESLFQKNQMRLEADRVEQERMHNDLILQCEELFDSYGTEDEEEVIKTQDVIGLMPTLREMLDACGVDHTERELEVMISLMDLEHPGKIAKEQFINAISRIVLGVRPVPIQEIAFQVAYCRKAIDGMTRDMRAVRKRVTVLGQSSAPTDTERTSFGEIQLHNLEDITRAHGVLIMDMNKNLEERICDVRKEIQDCLAWSRNCPQHANLQEPSQGDFSAAATKGAPSSKLPEEQGRFDRSFSLSGLPASVFNQTECQSSAYQSPDSTNGSFVKAARFKSQDSQREQSETYPIPLADKGGTKTDNGNHKSTGVVGQPPQQSFREPVEKSSSDPADATKRSATDLGRIRLQSWVQDLKWTMGSRAAESPYEEESALSSTTVLHQQSMLPGLQFRTVETSWLPGFGSRRNSEDVTLEPGVHPRSTSASTASGAADQHLSRVVSPRGGDRYNSTQPMWPYREPLDKSPRGQDIHGTGPDLGA